MPTHNNQLNNSMTKATCGVRGSLSWFWPWKISIGALCAMVLLTWAGVAAAKEIHSNGRGGGLWSEPQTWHGQHVPGPEDTAVIAMRDQVTFDRDDRDHPSCQALYLDPGAVLRFAKGRQHLTLSVAGPIESYGTIQLDATQDPSAVYELRLVGQGEAQRTIRLLPNAALLVYGAETHEPDKRNVRIIAASPNADAKRQPVHLVVGRRAMVDLHHAQLHDVQMQLAHLDNTGTVPGERLNIVGNDFTGSSWLQLTDCDTPLVRNNVFHTRKEIAPSEAISLTRVKLANLQGNTFQGPYATAVKLSYATSPMISQTQISGALRYGIWMERCDNVSIQDVEISDVAEGVWSYRVPNLVLKHVAVKSAQPAFEFLSTHAQLTDCSATVPPADAPVKASNQGATNAKEPPAITLMHLGHASAKLINTRLQPEQVTIAKTTNPLGDSPFVETMQYLVVRVVRSAADAQGANLPAGLRVGVRTAQVSGGSGGVSGGEKDHADLNVRNSPVPISGRGLTPLPLTHHALMVRSWRIDHHGKLDRAPFYELTIKVPSPDAGGGYKTLVSKTVEPDADWFRPQPNMTKPTIEVTLP